MGLEQCRAIRAHNLDRGKFSMPQLPGHPRIAIDAHTLVGKPRIAGTRIGVDLILRELAAGMTTATLLEAYPTITREDVAAALAYAADRIAAPAPIAAE